MRALGALSIFFLLAVPSATALSPITRVVELLRGLSEKVEKEGKVEEDLYEDYVCWGKSVISQKTASNVAAAARIDELETYISDLEAGRIELTGERADLEKEIAQLYKDLEEAKALREKENAEFLAAKKEMTQAINALGSAISVLEEATKDHKTGVLLTMESRLTSGAESLAEHKQNLKHAVALGEKFLDKADATFLKRLLSADVPKADWKKLNRKATFKMKYKARSFKIQDILKKMKGTFERNLQDAEENEREAQAAYQKLSASKQEQLDASQEALQKSTVENGARGQTKAEAQEEVDSLKVQIENDTKFIAQTKASLEQKKKEYVERKDLRMGELEAISKAIHILHNDDSRDLFKKSFASQEAFMFLQVEQKAEARSSRVLSVLRDAAQKSGDARLAKLAKFIQQQPEITEKSDEPRSVKVAFEPIIKMIDRLIETLMQEENEDLAIKEDCEGTRMKDTREAVDTSRKVDEMTEHINKLNEEIQQLKDEIKKAEEKKARTIKELAEATDLRKKENEEWSVSNREDKEAAILVESAKDVLTNFYKENDLVFIQKGKQPAEVQAGEAPPPPPATWEGGYGGATEGAQGIVAILEMIHEDIEKDRAKAKAEEAEAQALYDKLKEDSEAEIKALEAAIEEAHKVIGDKQEDVVETKDMRHDAKGSLDAVLTKMREIAPNCEYFTVNYKMRRHNRHIEIDGLQKAKAILMGADFEEGPDPNREVKPGDAFLQRRA